MATFGWQHLGGTVGGRCCKKTGSILFPKTPHPRKMAPRKIGQHFPLHSLDRRGATQSLPPQARFLGPGLQLSVPTRIRRHDDDTTATTLHGDDVVRRRRCTATTLVQLAQALAGSVYSWVCFEKTLNLDTLIFALNPKRKKKLLRGPVALFYIGVTDP